MIILNKPFSYEEFYKVKTLEDIKNSPSNSTLIFDYCESSLTLFEFCRNNNIPYGVNIKTIKELIFISNLKAKYAFADNIKNAIDFQKTAENYLLDTKIILLVENFDKIEEIAKFGIDGIKLKDWDEKTKSDSYK